MTEAVQLMTVGLAPESSSVDLNDVEKDLFSIEIQACVPTGKGLTVQIVKVTRVISFSCICLTCGKGFVAKSSLKAHMKIHSERGGNFPHATEYTTKGKGAQRTSDTIDSTNFEVCDDNQQAGFLNVFDVTEDNGKVRKDRMKAENIGNYISDDEAVSGPTADDGTGTDDGTGAVDGGIHHNRADNNKVKVDNSRADTIDDNEIDNSSLNSVDQDGPGADDVVMDYNGTGNVKVEAHNIEADNFDKRGIATDDRAEFDNVDLRGDHSLGTDITEVKAERNRDNINDESVNDDNDATVGYGTCLNGWDTGDVEEDGNIEADIRDVSYRGGVDDTIIMENFNVDRVDNSAYVGGISDSPDVSGGSMSESVNVTMLSDVGIDSRDTKWEDAETPQLLFQNVPNSSRMSIKEPNLNSHKRELRIVLYQCDVNSVSSKQILKSVQEQKRDPGKGDNQEWSVGEEKPGRVRQNIGVLTKQQSGECSEFQLPTHTTQHESDQLDIHSTEHKADQMLSAVPKSQLPVHSSENGGCPRTCKVCGKQVKRAGYLKVHMLIHKDERPYMCAVCGHSCIRNSHLTIHMMKHTGVRPHSCTLCAKTFTTTSTLRNHARVHTGEKPFICTICGKRFPQSSYLSMHKKRSHTVQKPCLCNICGKEYRCRSGLRKHTSSVHENRSFMCSLCQKSFRTTKVLTQHRCIRKIHGFDDPSNVSAEQSETSLSSKDGGCVHICLECGKRFNKASTLKQHSSIHKAERPYKCTVCGQTFRRNFHRIVHMRTHTGVKPYPCAVCGKAFISTTLLKSHMAIHTDEKPYPCNICEKRFSSMSNLNGHIRIHIGVKPYLCNICGRRFIERSTLKKHAFIHEDRSFSCSLCEKSYITTIGLIKHKRVSHGCDTVSCDICDKVLTNPASLRSHLLTHEKP